MKITIDNRAIETGPGTTILEAARQAGIEIPTLCHLDRAHCPTSCFVCVVRVNGGERLLPACATQVADGMQVESDTDDVRAARRMALELLFGDHLGDCLAPCQTLCPAHLDIPTLLRQVAAGDIPAAIRTALAEIPLPATLGRVCPRLCERGCRRAQADGAVAIRNLERLVGDAALAGELLDMPAAGQATGKRVAIVGAGPAGLSAAWYLQRDGHACTIYETRESPGGMLRDGVAEDILPRAVLEAEIGRIIGTGATLCPAACIGERIGLDTLRRDFDAVLLAGGEGSLERLAPGMRVDKSMATNLVGVFAAGAAVSPVRHAARAVGGGHAAADAIGQYLVGQPVIGRPRPFSIHIGRLQDDELAIFLRHAGRDARREPAALAGAADEARRCLHCDCRGLQTCKLRQYAETYHIAAARFKNERRRFQEDRAPSGIVYESGKCIDCGLCVAIAGEAREELGLAFIGRGFTVRVGVPFDESIAAGLTRVGHACVEACPTGALSLDDEECAEETRR